MAAPAIESVRAQLFFAGSIREGLPVLLAALEADEDLAPRRWGPAPGVHDAYDRAAVLAHATKNSADDFRLLLHRALPFAVELEAFERSPLGVVTIGMRAADPERSFAAIDRVALCLPLEYGCVDIRYVDQPPATRLFSGGGMHVDSYLKFGPPTFFARTYFGARLLELLGHGLDHTGGVVHELAPDVRALDLLPAPWTADAATLKRAQVRVEKALRLTGIVERKAGEWQSLAGPRWVPPPTP